MTPQSRLESLKDFYHHFLTMTWARFIVLVSASYFSINLFFGVIYFILGREGFSGTLSNDPGNFFLECFFFSVQTFSTIGYGYIAPIGFIHNVIVALEAFFGLISLGLMSGLFFSRFTLPSAKVIYSKQALITQYLGDRCLVFRLANARGNEMIDANISVTLLKNIVTPEGLKLYKMIDLPLIRSRTPVFYLSWTVAHIINEESPLFQMTQEELLAQETTISALVIGYDNSFKQTIHSRTIYKASDLVYDRHFVDIVHRSPEGNYIEVEKISDLR